MLAEDRRVLGQGQETLLLPAQHEFELVLLVPLALMV
jgi:hypothetical protein